MQTNPLNQITSTREVNAPVNILYQAFANPVYLKEWWGPEGFTNTIHEFDLQPGGKWNLTMHGPEKGNYGNSAVFTSVIPEQLVSWTRLSQPLFDMSIRFEAISPAASRMIFCMVFSSDEECEKMKKFVVPKNEENFDRLERVLAVMVK